MNRLCPVCETSLLESEELVPYEEYDDNRIGVLTFCSDECRDEYKSNE